MHTKLQDYLHAALQEYRREKVSVQNARLTGMTGCPRRKLMLHSGSLNFRPPLCRSKSAPRLGSIDEEQEEDESDSDSVCYRAAPEMTPSVSGSSTNDQSADSSLENSEDACTNPTFSCCGVFLEEKQCQKRLNSFEFDSISDESGYHEDKLLRGLSEESYYSDGELVMLEEDYEDSNEQMTAL
ncbi:PID domain-containing protein [Trichostrongylus colubriformis]|uniref:PID domain-containing protein n=1 Tax=Trichostrongylus colubriformis TaxID=6319 RepID=A0AAN8EPM9_TRICO